MALYLSGTKCWILIEAGHSIVITCGLLTPVFKHRGKNSGISHLGCFKPSCYTSNNETEGYAWKVSS